MGIAKVKAFPRGGVPAKKGIVDKPIRKEKDLFSVGNSADIKKKKKKPRKSEKVDSSEDALKVKTVEPLTYDKLTEGFKSLARISEIRDLELKLSLPGRLVAHVPITKISDHYTENLKKVAENPDNAERLNIKSLSEMYSVGQLVSCCIETIEKEKDFYNVTATLNPSNVNENVMKGHLVMAAVKSIEDHGYAMDVGQTHLRAFLKKSSDFLSVGQVVPCYVTKNDGSAVVLKSMTSKVNSVNNFQDLSVHQMYPGMLVNAKMEGNLKNGLEMKFGDFTGYVNVSYLKDEEIETGQDVAARILYILPTVNHIYMSLRPELAFGSTIELPPNEKIGDLAKNCPVLEVDQRGLTIKIGDSNGVVPFKHLNEKPSDLKAKFTNSQVTVRILQYDFFEQVFVCSMQKSFLEQSVIKLDQLKPGDIVNHCKIKKFADKGVIVEVGRGLDGFVPYFQLSDVPLKNPEKKFSIGDKIKCRVLKLDPRKRKLHLTHKKLLVENEFEIVDDFDSKFIGKITEGVVVQTSNEGVLLQLFGDARGYVPKSRISVESVEYPEKLFFHGQVLKCKVIEVNELTRKMILTLILSEEKLKPLGSKEKKASENIKKGILYENLKVCDINPDGLAVEVNGVKAVIPKNHLTDHAALADLLLSNYQINDTIEKALCFEKDVLPIMTLKPSILAFEQSDLAFDDLHQDQVLPTVVSNIKPYGVFAKLPLKKVRKAALIPLRLLSDNFVEDPNEDVQIQQTLYARITEIKEDKLTMTSKPSLVGFDEWKMTLSLFDDLAKVQNPQLENLQLGSVVNCKVQDVTQFGVDTILEDSNVRGLCPKAGFKDLEMPEKGETVAGVIVFLDHQFGVVELSMQPEIIERAMLVKIKKRPKEGQNVKAVCVLKRSELNLATFCIKSPNHAQGHFIHCPMMNLDKFDLFELYNIDIMHSDSRVVIGQIHDKRNKKRPRKTSESLSEKKPRLDSETEIKEEKPNDPGWDQDFNPWGTGILVENETKNEPMETEEAPAAAKKKIKTHLSKKEKKKLDELEEIAIQRAEQRAIEGQDLPPENVDEFDKLVLTSPDSSLCWIQYIAYHLERKEYDLARGVVKRALEKINFREENERFNVYMAWFNLENAYGTEDEANKVLKESLQCNDEFKVLAKVAEIYCASGKFEEAEEVLKKRARKFKKEIPVWLDLGLFYFKDKKDIKEARFVLQRALQNISQKTADIVMVSSKFAQFEFLHGESERGKTIFENIVRDYPSRSDQWSVYADMVVKNGEMEAAREIFERMITLGLPPKKMKSMFKKYWEFEQKHGDDVKVNAVRKKAVEYLEQQNVKLDEDEDPMEQLE